MKVKILGLLLCFLMRHDETNAQTSAPPGDEVYRPQVHFSPKAHWINDPNGMVYNKGLYHLFFQYHPGSSVWGPMHWGHATSKDLIHWDQQPIAIYPDSIGTIFSGSAVLDKNNTSGFGKKGQEPLVAIYTQHDTLGEKAHRNDFQNQSIAYSLDNGKTWIKYSANPVLHNPGITDFRDPKVMWYEPQKKWIMTLATKDRITFYSSPNLKEWKKESEFGEAAGAHGGVWECPDLFSLNDNGKKVWVLIVNMNPGGPNGGSATQYFLGDFNGNSFTASHSDIRWIDYGPDNYAGITWSNTGDRKIFLGWMTNWQYAPLVPTDVWRGAMTLPRELKLVHAGNEIFVASNAVPELSVIQSKPIVAQNISLSKKIDAAMKVGAIKFPCRINLALEKATDFSLTVSNKIGEEIEIGYDKNKKQFFIDRSKSGKVDFEKGFAGRHTAPRIASKAPINVSVIIDVSSVELFADDGLTTMTSIFFPNEPYNKIYLQSADNTAIKKLEYIKLTSILKQ
jgi:fructan beta-fructosidase